MDPKTRLQLVNLILAERMAQAEAERRCRPVEFQSKDSRGTLMAVRRFLRLLPAA